MMRTQIISSILFLLLLGGAQNNVPVRRTTPSVILSEAKNLNHEIHHQRLRMTGLGIALSGEDDTSRIALPDSISILLFSGFRVERLMVTAPRGSSLNGRADRKQTHTISLEDEALRVDGDEMATCTILPPDNGVLELSMRERRKRLRGRLTVTTRGDRLAIVGRMALRDYLAAALGTEASSSEPMEYLIALSALQRNYAISHSHRHAPDADLCDVTHCQVADFSRASSRMYAAVDRAMEITVQAGDALPCYYSANCGGSTLTPGQIWRSEEPGYSSVTCSHCSSSRRYRWERTIQATPEVEALLHRAPAPPFINDDFKIGLGRIAGFNKVLSNTIDRIERRGRNYLLAGRGFGHRVGLCMEGASNLASHGRSAADILRFYFPSAQVRVQQ